MQRWCRGCNAVRARWRAMATTTSGTFAPTTFGAYEVLTNLTFATILQPPALLEDDQDQDERLGVHLGFLCGSGRRITAACSLRSTRASKRLLVSRRRSQCRRRLGRCPAIGQPAANRHIPPPAVVPRPIVAAYAAASRLRAVRRARGFRAADLALRPRQRRAGPPCARRRHGPHWLGTDDVGRDVLARVIFGARPPLLAGVISVSIALAIGVPLGLILGLSRRLGSTRLLFAHHRRDARGARS